MCSKMTHNTRTLRRTSCWSPQHCDIQWHEIPFPRIRTARIRNDYQQDCESVLGIARIQATRKVPDLRSVSHNYARRKIAEHCVVTGLLVLPKLSSTTEAIYDLLHVSGSSRRTMVHRSGSHGQTKGCLATMQGSQMRARYDTTLRHRNNKPPTGLATTLIPNPTNGTTD